MFANTLTLTIDGVDKVLNRVNQDAYGSEYQFAGAGDSIIMKIRHSVDKVDKNGMTMKRHNVLVERTIFATPTALQQMQTATFTLRGGKFESPALAASLGSSLVSWLTSAVVTDLSVNIN